MCMDVGQEKQHFSAVVKCFPFGSGLGNSWWFYDVVPSISLLSYSLNLAKTSLSFNVMVIFEGKC